jgi:hypothetical protein
MYAIFDSESGLPLPIVLTHVALDNEVEPHEAVVLRSLSFVPTSWSCDPCATGGERYLVTTGNDVLTRYGWWQVIILGYDDERAIRAKLDHCRKVQEAQTRLWAAQQEYRELTC